MMLALFLISTALTAALYLLVTVIVAPHFRSSYAKTRVGATAFFLLSAAMHFEFLVQAPSGGIDLDDYGSLHMVAITGLQAAGLLLFLVGLYADQKLDRRALPALLRLSDRLIVSFADNRLLNRAMDWIDENLARVALTVVGGLTVLHLVHFIWS